MLNPLKWLWRILALGATTGLLILFFLRQHSGNYTKDLPEKALSILKAEADSCKATQDVPVSAALWYGDTLVASAHNNVAGANNAGGHAEINVLSKSLAKYGLKKFMTLDRNKLLFLTSYEPCYMCMGALTEYNISQLVFIGEKPIRYKIRNEDWPLLRYWIQKKHVQNNLQDQLFESYHKK